MPRRLSKYVAKKTMNAGCSEKELNTKFAMNAKLYATALGAAATASATPSMCAGEMDRGGGLPGYATSSGPATLTGHVACGTSDDTPVDDLMRAEGVESWSHECEDDDRFETAPGRCQRTASGRAQYEHQEPGTFLRMMCVAHLSMVIDMSRSALTASMVTAGRNVDAPERMR